MSAAETIKTNEPAAGTEKLDPKILRVAGVVFLGPLMSQLDSTVVNFSLSRIREDLHSSIESAQWIISGYLLALALMLPLNGWLVDRLGAKRLYLICFSAFTIASMLCGMATTMDTLIFARVFQGMAGGLLAPMTQMMLARVAGKQFSRVVGYTAIPVLLAPLLGPVVAGAILEYAGWPWLFYINLPIGILAVALAYFVLPNDTVFEQRRPFDFLGFILISPGLVSLLYGFEHIKGQGVWFVIAGFILMASFIFDALRKKSGALIDLRLFTNRIFRTSVITQFLSNGVLYAGQMLIPLFLITGFGFDASKAGWIMAPMGIGMLCVSPLLGFLTDKFGCRAVSVSGVLINTLGTLPFLYMIHEGFSPALSVVCMIARGAGQGITGIPSLAAAYASVTKEQLSLATTTMNVVQRLGGPIATTSIAFVVAIAAAHASGSVAAVTPNPHEFFVPFVILIAIQMSVFVSAMGLPLRIHQTSERKG